MLESGHVADAREALGRPYRLLEEIIAGRGVGRKLGFPTLNMKKPKQVIPAEGVYAGLVRIGKSWRTCSRAARGSGGLQHRPGRTYGDDFPLLIEAHLLNETAGAAGEFMAMDFIERIRSQHKFKTPEDLSRQIAKDCEDAGSILAMEPAR